MTTPEAEPVRAALEARWRALVGEVLPGLARPRGWPIGLDHCFARVLLDTAFGGIWYGFVAGRPAYRAMPLDALQRAVALGEAVAAGRADLATLNARSLAWRQAARAA